MLNGSCNCGAVTFEVAGKPWGVSNCHCGQCRKQSGNVWASAVIEHSNLKVEGTPRWYATSTDAQRGFCATCGCFLFWKHTTESSISFSLGAIDGPTGLTLEKHIFVADKGDYTTIADNVPQYDQ